MFAFLVAIVLLILAAAGVYLLLKSMGQDGVEAAAPGSCKSGGCGVQPRQPAEAGSTEVRGQVIRLDEIRNWSGNGQPEQARRLAAENHSDERQAGS